LRKDFVVKGAPLRGELKAAGIILFYYFARARSHAASTKLCFGNETAARIVLQQFSAAAARRVANEQVVNGFFTAPQT